MKKNETIVVLNGKKYRAVRAETKEMAQTICKGCAFLANCSKHGEKAVVPSFAGIPVCEAISCIWKNVKED